jgi:hypothetical protein
MIHLRVDIASFGNLTNETNISSTFKTAAVIFAVTFVKDYMASYHDDPSSSKGTF